MSGKFEIRKTESGKFMFNLKAANGQVILTSQVYEDKAGAETGISSVRLNAIDETRYDRRTATNGENYFVLIASNGQIIGHSEMYKSQFALEHGIATVSELAPFAPIIPLSYSSKKNGVNGIEMPNAKTINHHEKLALSEKGSKLEEVARRFKFYGAFANDPGAFDLFDEIERERDQRLIGD